MDNAAENGSLDVIKWLHQNRKEGCTGNALFLAAKVKLAVAACIPLNFFFKRNIRTHLDLLSIPQSGGKMSKRLGGIIGCKHKASSWNLNGFPYGSNIGSTV